MQEDSMNYMTIPIITKECNLERLDNISKFEKDWNGYGAEPIPSYVISITEYLVKNLDNQPEIFPTGRETIQMEYDCNFNYLEIEIFIDKIIMMFVPHSDEIDCDGKDYDNAKFYTCSTDALNISMFNFIINIFCTESFIEEN